jgi:hypothetical protein
LRLNEPIAFGRVEPLHDTGRHRSLPPFWNFNDTGTLHRIQDVAPHPRRIVFWRYKEIRSVRVGSSAGARELFTRALRETADGRLRVPILMAPMASACPASLAIAVANAGGLGGCGALLMPPDAIHKWVSDVRAGTNGGFPTQSLDARSAAQARLRRGTPGLAPKPTIIRIRRVLNTANRRMFYGRSVVDFARSKEASTVSQRSRLGISSDAGKRPPRRVIVPEPFVLANSASHWPFCFSL